MSAGRLVIGLVWLGVLSSARAEPAGAAEAQQVPASGRASDAAGRGTDELSEADMRLYRRLSRPRGGYARLMLCGALGRGLRFNNPFRLQTQLGATPRSLSLTASYADLAAAVGFGDPSGLQHGGAVHLSVALQGVAQQALSAGYLLMYRGARAFMGYGRVGPTVLLAPDPNLGGELAVGGAVFLTGALGLTAELVGDLFYGAGSWERERTAVPVLSAQAGFLVDFEVLP